MSKDIIKRLEDERSQLLTEKDKLQNLLDSLDKLSVLSLSNTEFKGLYLKFHKYTCQVRDELDKRVDNLFRKILKLRNKKK